MEEKGREVVDKLKELVKEGNVTRIRVLRNGDSIINIPMTAGVIGAGIGLVAAPWALIAGAVAAVGFKCRVEVEKKDGQIVTVYGKDN